MNLKVDSDTPFSLPVVFYENNIKKTKIITFYENSNINQIVLSFISKMDISFDKKIRYFKLLTKRINEIIKEYSYSKQKGKYGNIWDRYGIEKDIIKENKKRKYFDSTFIPFSDFLNDVQLKPIKYLWENYDPYMPKLNLNEHDFVDKFFKIEDNNQINLQDNKNKLKKTKLIKHTFTNTYRVLIDNKRLSTKSAFFDFENQT